MLLRDLRSPIHVMNWWRQLFHAHTADSLYTVVACRNKAPSDDRNHGGHTHIQAKKNQTLEHTMVSIMWEGAVIPTVG